MDYPYRDRSEAVPELWIRELGRQVPAGGLLPEVQTLQSPTGELHLPGWSTLDGKRGVRRKPVTVPGGTEGGKQ